MGKKKRRNKQPNEQSKPKTKGNEAAHDSRDVSRGLLQDIRSSLPALTSSTLSILFSVVVGSILKGLAGAIVALTLILILGVWVVAVRLVRPPGQVSRRAAFSSAGIATLVLAAGGIVGVRLLPPEEGETHGLLLPANAPLPPSICGNIPAGAMMLFFGNSAAYTEQFPHTVIRVRGEEIISLDKEGDGVALNSKLYSPDGRIVAEIRKNEFFLNPNNYFRKERPDRHSLIVYDQRGTKVLSIRFLNRQAIKLLGIFSHVGSPPVVINESVQQIGGLTLSNTCFGNNGTDIAVE